MFDVVVRAEPDVRRSLTDIRRLLIDVPGGGHVRLGKVADVRVRSTPAVIQREASQRRIDVSANVSGRSVGDVRNDVRDRIRDLRFPLEYHAEAIGAASGDEATVSRLLGFGIVAAIGIFLLLQAAFRSWRLAGLAFATLPLAVVGGLLASLIDGTTFSLGALIGLFAVFAIAARNVIALIEPLPAPRAARGQEPRPRARHPGVRGTACADPDDRVRNRPGRCSRSCSSATVPASRSCTRWPW